MVKDGPPQGTNLMICEFINRYLLLIWLKHFKSFSNFCAEEPLLRTPHSRDTQSYLFFAAINFCRENENHLLCLPPYSFHRLQPLNVEFSNPTYSQKADKWIF